jgi:serine protease inhibitor
MMPNTAAHLSRSRGRRGARRPTVAGACLLAAVLVAGCGDTTPTQAPGTPAPAVPSAASPTGSAGPATPGPTAPGPATPAPSAAGSFAPGSLAVTVSDRIRVRSQPRVSDDSIKYEPLLPTGTQLLVIEGPVEASGYTWYHVSPVSLTLDDGVADGWVAIADHDGTPWVALNEAPIGGLRIVQANVARANATLPAAKQAADGLDAFAVAFYRRLLADPALDLGGRGVVFSPASIALALAMARAGGRGDTAAEMDQLLHVTGWSELEAQLGSLQQELAAQNATWTDYDGTSHALSLQIANAAFAQDGWPIEQPYLDRIARAFGAGLGLVDFVDAAETARQAINAWVARQTVNRIKELLGAGDVSSMTRLVLVNTVYLKANWQQEFNPDATKARTFTVADGTTVQVPTMELRGGPEVPLVVGTGWRATELGYLGADGSTPLAMTLILPDDVAAFDASLSAGRLTSILASIDAEHARQAKLSTCPPPNELGCSCYPYSVDLFLPRFGIDTRVGLNDILKSLGMQAAFDPTRADFSGISTADQIVIARVIHEANIDVDEMGTVAAAATAIVGDTTGGCGGPAPLKTRVLRLNHPFLFLIRDVKTGAILFMGRVLDPSKR